MIYYLIVISIITFIIYSYDKLMAKLRKRRVREVTLLTLSILGGAFGGFLAMLVFNHKTRVNRFIIINLFLI